MALQWNAVPVLVDAVVSEAPQWGSRRYVDIILQASSHGPQKV